MLAVCGAMTTSLALASCSDAYASTMQSACDGLSQAAVAYEAGDREGIRDGLRMTGWVYTAAEEATGDEAHESEVRVLQDALDVLSPHSPGAVRVDGTRNHVWPPPALPVPQQRRVDSALRLCERY